MEKLLCADGILQFMVLAVAVALQTFHKIPWVSIIAPDRINYNRPVGNQNIFWVCFQPTPLPAHLYLPRSHPAQRRENHSHDQAHLICSLSSFPRQSFWRVKGFIASASKKAVFLDFISKCDANLENKDTIYTQNYFQITWICFCISSNRTNKFSYLDLVWCDPW